MKTLARLVSRKIAILFPDPAMQRRVEAQLSQLSPSDHPQLERLQLAVLKLCNRNPDEINIAGAKEDPDDTIAFAEQPELMRASMQNRKLRPDEKTRIDAADWDQYHNWFGEGLK